MLEDLDPNVLSPPSAAWSTLVEMLRARAEEAPRAVAYTFISDEGDAETDLTYGELDRRARAIAVQLRERGVGRVPALLLYPPGLDYIAGFFGCLYAGVIAVPAYPPLNERQVARLHRVVRDAGAKVVLSTTQLQARVQAFMSRVGPAGSAGGRSSTRSKTDGERVELGYDWFATDEVLSQSADAWSDPGVTAGDLAFLQYTSGSTSAPKGVMLTHQNLMHNLRCIGILFAFRPGSATMSWLPPYHDMGLIGQLLEPAYYGLRTYLMSPAAFIQRPMRWLQTISRTRAEVSGGPNFAYDLCVQKARVADLDALDLSCWRVAFNGAEPVRAETLERFARTFGGCGFDSKAFYPCYGMAEATLILTGGDHSKAPLVASFHSESLRLRQVEVAHKEARRLVGNGQAALAHRIEIVDPDGLSVCPPGRVGEIWVASPSVAAGYWGREEQTRQTFEATLAGEGPFLRTGDLGFLYRNELFVVGRLKDLIILRGRNLHPEDIEHSLNTCHPDVRTGGGAAFAVEDAGEERLVVAQEIVRHPSADHAAIVRAIQTAVAEEHGVEVHAVALLQSSTLPKTSSGKVQRYLCREAFLAGELHELFRWVRAESPVSEAPIVADGPLAGGDAPFNADRTTSPGRERIEEWLTAWVARVAGVSSGAVAVNQPLAHYGLASRDVVALSGDLERWLGCRLSPVLAYQFPTIEALAAHLASSSHKSERPAPRAAASDREPIAIVGLSCRFPGAPDAEAYWRLLREGVDAVSEPAERWAMQGATAAELAQLSTLAGGFLDRADEFDAEFFGISPREAVYMDPQQRLALEVAWEALERAGALGAEDRSRTGVFMGISTSDYAQLMVKLGAKMESYVGTGTAASIAANRLSYQLDLSGPSLAVDTACSSSLVATHLAVNSLRRGECNLALAGGVNLLLSADPTRVFSQARMMSRGGRCRTFDAGADGYVRGEGCGVIVLKRLSDAVSDGDRVIAVIRGSAVNQDGRSNGLTAPNGMSQRAVIRQALEDAGLAAADLDYVEAHGTGTPLGDPIEMDALREVLLEKRPVERCCAIGSVKTNIGHLEAAAGIAGLIKAALAIEHGEVPAHLHLQRFNPAAAFDDGRLMVPRQTSAWPSSGAPRRAGVSSFGFGGTNCHVVLEQAPPPRPPAVPERSYELLALSARTERALTTLAARIARSLEGEPSLSLADVCCTINAGRPHHGRRIAVRAASMVDLREALLAFAAGDSCSQVARGQKRSQNAPRVAFLFTGEGAHYPGMGRELYATEPTFRRELERCDEVLRPWLEEPLSSVLYGSGARRLDEPVYAQAAVFSLQWCFHQLWSSWGIQARAVMGHGVGEIVAACAAGAVTLEQGLPFLVQRERLLQSLSLDGVRWPNGSRDVRSPPLDSILDELEVAARGIEHTAPALDWISSVTGTRMGDQRITAEHWRRHARETVRFREGLQTLRSEGYSTFVELGPSPMLTELGGKEDQDEETWLCTSRRGVGDRAQLLQSLGQLYVGGAAVSWAAFHGESNRRRVALPTYPFERQRYWFEPGETRRIAGGGHPLLGRRLALPNSREVRFESEIDTLSKPLFEQHRVLDGAVLPAAAYLELALAAGAAVAPSERWRLEDVEIRRALLLSHGEGRELQTVLAPASDASGASGHALEIHSRPSNREAQDGDEAWTLHVSARLTAGGTGGQTPQRVRSVLESRWDRQLAPDELYRRYEARGVEYGPAFRAIEQLWYGQGVALGRLRLPIALRSGGGADRAQYRFHPALLDGCLQVIGAAFADDGAPGTWLPVAVTRLELHDSPGEEEIWSYVEVRTDSASPVERVADVHILHGDGRAIADLRGVRLRAVRPEVLRGDSLAPDSWLYQVEWRPQSRRGRQLPVDYLPQPSQLREVLEPELRAITRLHRAELDSYPDAFSALERLAFGFIVDALQSLGWQPSRMERFSAPELADRLGVVARHRRLWSRMLEILAEEGALRRDGDRWTVIEPSLLTGGRATLEQALARCKRFDAARHESDLLARTATPLAKVLLGQVEPLDLLFPEGELTTVSAIYQDSAGAQVLNRTARLAITSSLARLPKNRTLRILEVGAGTGATTAHVLSGLPHHQTEYVFTDVSPRFLAHAKQKFREYPFLQFKLFDVEQPPEPQGFPPQTYDWIVASNVLHATQDLGRSVQHLRQLLAPGGVLLLCEGIQRVRWLDLTFGLAEGWWRFTDTRVGPSYPLLDEQHWQELLLTNGFAHVANVAPSEKILAPTAILLAQTPVVSASSPAGDSAARGVWVVFADAAASGNSIGEQFALLASERGKRPVLVFAGEGYAAQGVDRYTVGRRELEGWSQILETLVSESARLEGVIFLWSASLLEERALGSDPSMDWELFHDSGWGSALLMIQGLAGAQLPRPPALWLITRGATPAGESPIGVGLVHTPLWGMGRTLQLEHPEFACRLVDLDPQGGSEARDLLEEILADDTEDQIAFRERGRYVARLVRSHEAGTYATPRRLPLPARPSRTDAFRLEIMERGVLSQLELRSVERVKPGPGRVEILIRATGLNFRDVLNAMGLYPGDPGPLGCDTAGVVVAVGEGVEEFRLNDEVVAIASGTLGSHVTVEAALIAHKPKNLSFEQAATLPIAFVTAQYALHECGRIAAGDRVLIHSAGGGVGQAAIQLARRAGATVHATASPAKWKALEHLDVQSWSSSRSLDFSAEALRDSGGRGVDVVLNCFTGEFIPKGLSCLAAGGRFIEIGKSGVWTHEQVAAFKASAEYAIVDLQEVCRRSPERVGAILRRLMPQFEDGSLQPIPCRVFPIEHAVEAFRVMQRAEHVGKLVCTMPQGQPARAEEQPVVFLEPNASYLITGGLGDLGLLVAGWMVDHGARHLVLVSRRKPSAEDLAKLAALEARGVQPKLVRADVSNAEELGEVISSIDPALPLKGILHAAGILDDAPLLQQSRARFSSVLSAKLLGAWNLHCLTRQRDLDFFVLFASVAGVFGSAGQANHAAANAFLDGLAHHRRALGLPALSIDWGIWSRLGAAARRHADKQARMKAMGSIQPQQGIASFGELLQSALNGGVPQVAVVPIDWQLLQDQVAVRAFLSDFGRGPEANAPPADGALLERVQSCSVAERKALLVEYLGAQVARVLGWGPERVVDTQQGFFDVGMDSLTSLELRNLIQRSLGCSLPTTVAFDYPNIEALAGYLAETVSSPSGEAEVASDAPWSGTSGSEEPGDAGAQSPAGDVRRMLDDKLSTIEKFLNEPLARAGQ